MDNRARRKNMEKTMPTLKILNNTIKTMYANSETDCQRRQI